MHQIDIIWYMLKPFGFFKRIKSQFMVEVSVDWICSNTYYCQRPWHNRTHYPVTPSFVFLADGRWWQLVQTTTNDIRIRWKRKWRMVVSHMLIRIIYYTYPYITRIHRSTHTHMQHAHSDTILLFCYVMWYPFTTQHHHHRLNCG